MTMEQIDTLNRLIDIIVAHGDVVIASGEAEFADHTLSVLGDAIQCVCLLQNASLLTNHRQRS